MDAAGVISEHPANRAVIMSRGIRTEDQAPSFDLSQHFIEHDARLNPDQFLLFIDFEHAIVVLGEVNDHGDVATLASQAGSTAAASDGCAKFSASRNGVDDVELVAWDNDSNWNLS